MVAWMCPSLPAALRSSVVQGGKWVQLPDPSAMSLPSMGTAWHHRWEMVKALIVAHGFVVFNFLPRKKNTKLKISKKHPGRWRAGFAAVCVLGLGAAWVAPFLQTKTHHKTPV